MKELERERKTETERYEDRNVEQENERVRGRRWNKKECETKKERTR
jgi:hypothetical protein